MKETSVINHVDEGILRIQRRHAKKFSRAYEGETRGEIGGGGEGYESFKELSSDIEGLINVVWVSGTRMFRSNLHINYSVLLEYWHTNYVAKATLQIPYTISLAILANSSLPGYPFAPRPTFRLLRKLDAVFASLLLGEDADAGTGSPLPGFGTRRNVVSMTEKVRIKSIAEACRMVVMEVRGRGDDDDDDDDDDIDNDGGGGAGDTTDTDDDEDMIDVLGDNTEDDREMPGRWETEAARVYERTIQILGDELGRQGEFGVDVG